MGVNMISKKSLIKAITVKDCDMYGQCLSSNVKHHCNFNEFTIQLRYFFVWSYKTNYPKCTSFVANKHIA